MSISLDITIATVKYELEECLVFAKKFGFIISEFDENNLIFDVQFTSTIDNQVFWAEFDCTNYPAWPPLIEFFTIDPEERGTPRCYPKSTDSFFHPSVFICNPCSRKAYKEVFAGTPHKDWVLNNWKAIKEVGTLTTLPRIITAIDRRISNSQLYAGRMSA